MDSTRIDKIAAFGGLDDALPDVVVAPKSDRGPVMRLNGRTGVEEAVRELNEATLGLGILDVNGDGFAEIGVRVARRLAVPAGDTLDDVTSIPVGRTYCTRNGIIAPGRIVRPLAGSRTSSRTA